MKKLIFTVEQMENGDNKVDIDFAGFDWLQVIALLDYQRMKMVQKIINETETISESHKSIRETK